MRREKPLLPWASMCGVVLAGPLDLGSVSPWNCELCRYTELGLC